MGARSQFGVLAARGFLLACTLLSPLAFSSGQELHLDLPESEQAKIDVLSAQAGEIISSNRTKFLRPKILVMDFSTQFTQDTSKLGVLLADCVARSLASRPIDFDVVDRARLSAYFLAQRMDSEEILDEDLGLDVAGELGASGVIRGSLLQEPDGRIKVRIQYQDAHYKSKFADADLVLPATLVAELKQAGRPQLAPVVIPEEPGILQLGESPAEGIVWPTCRFCSAPSYSNEARKEHTQGTVKLSIIVSKTGEVSGIRVVKPARFGLTEQAIEAVGKWKMNPAIRDGKPSAVRVTIETTFRLYN
jgi:TonB family protein